MEITNNSNLVPFLNKKVRVITEINSVFIGKLYFVDGKKNFKLSNCREFITRFGVYRYNGFFKNVNFNGGKKMTIDFDFNYQPLTTENSTLSSMVYPSKSFERIQGNERIKPAEIVPPRVISEPKSIAQDQKQGVSVTKELDAGPMFYDLEESRSSQRIDQEILLRGATKKSSGKPVFYASKTSNLQGNQRVETPEIFTNKKLKVGSMSCDPEKPSTSQRILPGNQFLVGNQSFPRSKIFYSETQRNFQDDQRVELPEASLRDVTNEMNSRYTFYNYCDRSSAFQKGNHGNQSVVSQDVFVYDAAKRMEALSMICNSESPSTSQGSVQGNQNGIPSHPQNLPVFPNTEGQYFGQGSRNIPTHAVICIPIIMKMEFRLSN